MAITLQEIRIIDLTFNSIVLLFHLTDICLLGRLIQLRRYKVQHLLFLNLSFSIFVTRVLGIIVHNFSRNPHFTSSLFIFVAVMMNVVYIPAMVYITLDRLLAVLLNLRYRVCVTKKRVKHILLLTWIISIITSTISCLNVDFKLFRHAFVVISPVIDISYLLFFIASYVTMFLHLKSSGAAIGITRTFRESRFFIAIMLGSSFVLYNTVGDLFGLVVEKNLLTQDKIPLLYFIAGFTQNLCLIFDSLIYMVMDRDIKNLLHAIVHVNRPNAVVPAGRITIQNAGQPAVIYNAH